MESKFYSDSNEYSTKVYCIFQIPHFRPMSIVMRLLCIQAIIIGAFGGILGFISSIQYVMESDYVPCYIKEMPHEC